MEVPKKKAIDHFLMVCAVILSVVSLYTAFFGTFPTMIQRTFHLTMVFIIALFLYRYPFAQRFPKIDLTINMLFAGLFIAANLYLAFNWQALYVSPFLTNMEIFLGVAAIVIILELTRRTVGIFLSIIVLLFMVYAYFGAYFPGFLAHRGYSLERIVVQVFAGTEGIYGIPIGVSATLVIVFVVFGAFIEKGGASDVFLNIATALAGGRRGGPAKASIFSSGFMGMLSGSSAANVATTGSVTIPMMKKSGMESYVAGAVEAVASSGGYKTPPIMGAVAFIMAQMAGMSYWDVALAATLPAFFHYYGLYLMVDLYAGYKGFKGIEKQLIPPFLPAVKKGLVFMVPVVILVVLMAMRYSAMYACAYSLLSLWIISIFTRSLNLSKIIGALYDGAVRMIWITVPCAAAGIILGILTMTGVGMKLNEIIAFLAGQSLFFTLFWIMVISIILGMGLPPVVSYLVLAALEVPVLVQMGVTPLAAHMFIFYFCALSLITPPICTTAFTAAAIAGAPPMKTGLEAVRFGIVLYTLPYLFVYNPALLLHGNLLQIIFVFIIAAIGIFALAIAAQGYFKRNVGWIVRVLFFASSILVFSPSLRVTAAGMVLLIFLLVFEMRAAKKLNAQSITVAKSL
ncbi:TRAP transporter permease [Desulfatitalea alkaliphila]|uniref:TRAP transporter fused permease subunit n=1 Tax=Desulfatitalea alkaliphila TaxID=2929485 RepID=A0AA41UIE5_9BACT|nr:TRAP transporter fused permease subunit [Desulfatitalea alkaliphila]MCJ8500700.1 TRAP transporter fused permease subunit [Desulfatitalea alkaliphila]